MSTDCLPKGFKLTIDAQLEKGFEFEKQYRRQSLIFSIIASFFMIVSGLYSMTELEKYQDVFYARKNEFWNHG
jgi:formate hydrogenlyase subunit 3/multisubunit Na+/H+ antiporter MnhD subunit